MSLIRCNICRGIPPSPFLREPNWVWACPCGWFHRKCIEKGIIRAEAVHPGANMTCPRCFTSYLIVPPPPTLATALYRFTSRWKLVHKSVTLISTMIGFNVVSISIGLINLMFICGRKEVITAFCEDPFFIADICFCITGFADIISNIPWEEYVLHILRRGSHLPMIGRILPMDNPEVIQVTHRTRSVENGLLLPISSKLTGDLVFYDQQSKLKRFFLGGATFLIVKGFFTMYYRQKLYNRLCSLDIENYEQENV